MVDSSCDVELMNRPFTVGSYDSFATHSKRENKSIRLRESTHVHLKNVRRCLSSAHETSDAKESVFLFGNWKERLLRAIAVLLFIYTGTHMTS